MAVPSELAAFEKVLGKSSGAADDPADGSRQLVFWRALGVRGNREKSGRRELREVDFYFKPIPDLSSDMDCQPFPGEFVLEGQTVTRATDPADLGRRIGSLRKEMFEWWHLYYERTRLHVVVAAIAFAKEPGVDYVSVQPMEPQ